MRRCSRACRFPAALSSGRAKRKRRARKGRRARTMARTSSKKDKQQPPLLTGPVRAYKDNAAGQIVIETTKFNAAGSDLEVCRLELGRAADARMIVALPAILKFAEAFAALGQCLEGAEPDSILITHGM